MRKKCMYLHRYPHIQEHTSIHQQHTDLHIPRQCILPKISQSVVLTSLQSMVFSHRCGASLKEKRERLIKIKMSTIMTRSPLRDKAFPSPQCRDAGKPTWDTLLGTMAVVVVGVYLFLPDKMVLQGHLQGCASVFTVAHSSHTVLCTKTREQIGSCRNKHIFFF